MDNKQSEIIKRLKAITAEEFDAKKEIRRSIDFLKNFLTANKFFDGYVLGISGGQDSTLAGKLIQLAIDELNIEFKDREYSFTAIGLPYGKQADQADVDLAMQYISPTDRITLNIKQPVDDLTLELETKGIEITDFNKGNVKARMRMVYQYAVAGAESKAVVGTDHSGEAVTGFYTKYGDGASDLTPLYRLNKRQGRAMLIELGAPKSLYDKTPTADLEELRPSLPDVDALGVTYDEIDDFLEGKEISKSAAQKIIKWYETTEHKRRMPYTIYDF